MKNHIHLYIYLFLIFISMLLYFAYVKYMDNERIKNTLKSKPCSCVTYSQYALWSEKYNRFVSENKQDSVAKYAELLNQIK